MGVDRATGKIVGFAADHVLDGGGLANFSANVATVSANAAIGIYYVPKVDFTTYAFHSRAVTAGSMRSYGTLQTMTALEVMVDELCTALPLDPIRVPSPQRARDRRPDPGRKHLQRLDPHPGNSGQAREASDLATARRGEGARAAGGASVGTGVACATKDYGTGADVRWHGRNRPPMAGSQSTATPPRWATRLGTAVGQSRRVPSRRRRRRNRSRASRFLRRRWSSSTSGDPYTITQATQDAAARNPRWVPVISSATAASIGAYVGTHAAAEAARVVFRFGLWPAALELWGIAPSDPQGRALGGGALEGQAAHRCRAWRR